MDRVFLAIIEDIELIHEDIELDYNPKIIRIVHGPK